jgi:hypothetical protein
VVDGGQRRREGGGDVIGSAVDREALPLPGQVVVVGDDRDARLGDDLRDGEGQRDVERDRQGVLDDEEVEIEVPDEGEQLVAQVSLDRVDPAGDVRGADVGREEVAPPDAELLDPDGGRLAAAVEDRGVDRLDLGVLEVSLGHKAADLGRPIDLAGEVEAQQAELLQGRGPLGGLERDAVGTRKPRRNEPRPAAGDRGHPAST